MRNGKRKETDLKEWIRRVSGDEKKHSVVFAAAKCVHTTAI